MEEGMEDTILLDPEDLAARLEYDNVVLIDTRDPDSYNAGHIPGAVNVHDIFTYLATSTADGTDTLRSSILRPSLSLCLNEAKPAADICFSPESLER